MIPNTFLVALYLPVHAGLAVEPDQFFISSIVLFGTGYGITVSYYDGATNPVVASVTVPRSTHTENASYSLIGTGDFEDTIGKIAIGKTNEIDALPAGQYLFTFEGACLDQDCIRPMIRSISSFRVVNGSETSPRYYGDLEFAAGNNTRLTPIVVTNQPTRIRWDAIEGEGLNNECICDDSDAEAPPIRTINDVPPTPEGEFTLVGVGCLNLEPATNGLKLTDRCAEPCCGCPTLEQITEDVNRLGEQARSLQTLVNTLSGRVSQFENTILASTLGDRGCVSC
jgi:hypothetical protein